MASQSLQTWLNERRKALDEIENAHRTFGGTGPGRRVATRQINYAYTVLLSSHFQGFCRDLHDECVKHPVQCVVPGVVQDTFGKALLLNRRLDRGNPNPGNIGSDFGPFGFVFWERVQKVTYTFSPKHGLVGGQIVPYLARLLGGRIDPQRKDEVAVYLTSFGLTPHEAEDVIQAVGTGPVKKPRRTKAGTA